MNQPKILIVEDDEDDRDLLLTAVRQANKEVELVVAEHGLQAIEYLEALQGDVRGNPCLIVLDLNLPYLDGRATFDKIRANSSLKGIPVIIFSSSNNPHDQSYFRDAGAEFITKPLDYRLLPGIADHMVTVCSNGCSQ